MNRKGFTLVELLAVIVILAIIMIIAIPSVLTTMATAKQSSFKEYVSKVYSLAHSKYLEENMGTDEPTYVKYDITKDLGLTSTGSYKGYAVILNKDGDKEVYIGMTDGEYHTATKLGTTDDTIVNYINYTVAGEPEFTAILNRFDGKHNSFVTGDVTNFDLPDNESDFKGISNKTEKENEFEIQLKDFYSKAYARFQEELAANNMTNIFQEEWNYREDSDPSGIVKESIGFYSYKMIYGEIDSRFGFVIINDYDFNDESSITDYSSSVMAYKNENYHTGNKRKHYTRDKNGKTHVSDKYDQTIEVEQEKNGSPMFGLSRIDEYYIIDFNAPWEKWQNETGRNPDDLSWEEMTILEKQLSWPLYTNSQNYMTNSNTEDGLTDNKYTVKYYVEKDNAYFQGLLSVYPE